MNTAILPRLTAALVRHTPVSFALEPRLHAALTQLIQRPGKLVRAQLVLVAAERHGLRPRAAEELACAVEFFHTASLVLDDLPCMDDATTRRGQPCIHRTHGEATAILAALALINRAYALTGAALASQPGRLRVAAQTCIERALGAAGLVGGQAWDLAFARTDRSAVLTSRIAQQKTGALFALAIGLPAVLARPTPEEAHQLHALAVYWGQQFQIADDLRDVLTSSAGSDKTTGRDRALTRPNLALVLGVPAARARLARLGRQVTHALETLCAATGDRWTYLRAFNTALAAAPETDSAAA